MVGGSGRRGGAATLPEALPAPPATGGNDGRLAGVASMSAGLGSWERRLRPRASLSIVETLRVDLGATERRALKRLAGRLLTDEPALDRTWPFGATVAAGLGPWPALVFEDHSGLGLFRPEDDRAYAYRALLLAEDGDFLAIGPPRNTAFEAYAREVLGLGRVEVVMPAQPSGTRSLAERCAADSTLIDRLAAVARQHGGLNLLPYMGIGGAWVLAGTIAARSGCAVGVATPPPRLTRRVNDKLWFAERVAEVIGRQALPPSHAAFGLTALTRRMRVLAERHAQVAVKVPDSAAAAGNLVFDAAELRVASSMQVRGRLAGLLRRAGWRGGFPLLATGWEQPIAGSPSVQLWIPGRDEATPVAEGVFDQRLADAAGRFAGAVPSALPEAWQRRMAEEAVRLGTLFQELGYFGRCSFDAILVGDGPSDWRLHWIECNGRWGGVSIPLTLANRLSGDRPRRPFMVVDRSGLAGAVQDISAYLDALDDLLLVPSRRHTGIIFLTPGRIESGTGFDLMAVGESTVAAEGLAKTGAARVLDVMENA